MWLENLIGFNELEKDIYKNIDVKDKKIFSKVNGKEYHYGTLEIATLKELKEKVKNSACKKGKLTIKTIVSDAKTLHLDIKNENTLFQVASQFNLLEMVNPDITPQKGIEIYENDSTQGPICAISAGAGTIYRNYFAQTSQNQIDCLFNIGEALGNKNNTLWEMRNGYALLKEEGLIKINSKLENMSDLKINRLREELKIGLQWDTQVTLNNSKHRVSQAYSSALPMSYVGFSTPLWKPFASLILEATYEATICAGILNALKYNKYTIYLTLVGGGAFGNELDWIVKAIKRASILYKDYELDVVIVNYRHIDRIVKRLETKKG